MGFTPGEADQLRRGMAAWRRKGGLEPFEQKLIDGMRARGHSEDFARRVYAQIQGFGEYGFPESHAASFALLVYASAWLKCHEPAAFLCALLNSQPMGFYRPAQLVQDAQRHGVRVLPVDVVASDWSTTLAGDGDGRAAGRLGPVRLGLHQVRGLTAAGAAALVAARRAAPFGGVGDLVVRSGLSRRDLDALADADALTSLAGHRRQAAWAAAAAHEWQAQDLFAAPAPAAAAAAAAAPGAAATVGAADFALPAPTLAQSLVADYATLGLTLRAHPLLLLRPRFDARRYLCAADLNVAADRRLARAVGLVTCRQRPGTASGIVFVTLEDESGWINVVVHADLVERQRRELLGARLLGVLGQVQRAGEVVHLIAKRLVDHSDWLGELAAESRDFC